ncbi:hypothetical protein B0T22DRAFT_57625 [Podospora appendiculata]|uniref:Uncharacterized protein n=1 Tax=Podospora appendiculata TaxID=314037 RepID=A0AAE1CGS0_9PEZI|nr:hypothetical protein B0T22DRAFT_57625 [Podospora appendiculata]
MYIPLFDGLPRHSLFLHGLVLIKKWSAFGLTFSLLVSISDVASHGYRRWLLWVQVHSRSSDLEPTPRSRNHNCHTSPRTLLPASKVPFGSCLDIHLGRVFETRCLAYAHLCICRSLESMEQVMGGGWNEEISFNVLCPVLPSTRSRIGCEITI